MTDSGRLSGVGQSLGADGVVRHACARVPFDHGDVLVGRGVQHDPDLVVRERPAHGRGIGDRAEHRHDLGRGAGADHIGQFPVELVEGEFVELEQDDPAGGTGQNLTGQFAADRSAGTRDHHHLAGIDRRGGGLEHASVPAEKVRRVDGLDPVEQGPLADQRGETGHGRDLAARSLEPPGEPHLFRPAQGGHRQHHPVDPTLDDHLLDSDGRMHRQTGDRKGVQRLIVVDEGHRFDMRVRPQRRGELHPGLPGAVDQHPVLGSPGSVDGDHKVTQDQPQPDHKDQEEHREAE